MKKLLLGLDIGGVIHDWMRFNGSELDFGGPLYLKMPPMDDAFESIATLNKESTFAGNIYLVTRYKEGPERTLEWLKAQNFWEKTGIDESHFNGCIERHEKLAICKGVGVTHFVDDRAEVLSHLIGTVPHLFQFNGREEEKEEFKEFLPSFTQVASWKELLPLLLAAK